MAEDLGGSYDGARWSYNLARPPGWLAGESNAVIQWYHDNVFDRQDIDPNATLAQIENTFRNEAARLGVRAPADSAGCLQWYGALQVGEADWKTIAGQTGSAQPSGAGSLSTPYLDAYAANQSTAIAALAAAPPATLTNDAGTLEQTDANVLAWLADHGFNADAGLSRALSTSPVPAPEMRATVALGQSSNQGASPYSGLSSFSGMGTNGLAYDAEFPQTASAGTQRSGINPLFIMAAVAAAAYFLLKKGS